MDRLTANERASLFYSDTDTWTDARGYQLSDRLWQNKADLRRAIDQTIRDGIRNGDSLDDVSTRLTRYINPTYAKPQDGRAHYAATRLAGNETRRAHALGTQDTAKTNPTGGYLKFTTSAGHIDQDECTDIAARSSEYGRGVYSADDCPLPPRHVGCRCSVSNISDHRDMKQFVDRLRVDYGLQDPPDMTPAELAVFRRETAPIREAVQIMFRAWLQQTGLVTTEQLVATSPTVAQWVSRVRAEKARRRR